MAAVWFQWLCLPSVVLVWFCGTLAGGENVLEALSKDPDLSKFYALVTKDDVVRTFLQHRTATVLAPTNAAMERGKGSLQDGSQAASFHVLNLLAFKETFPVAQTPVLAGAPPVYLTVKETREPWEEKEYYANNALILRTAKFQTASEQTQILYVIDDVLTPYVANTNAQAPDAARFLDQPATYGISESLALFSSRVKSEHQLPLFSRAGYHTFFVPVGGGIGETSINKIQDVDAWVIRGHVIPNKVLFTRPMGWRRAYRSEAYGNTVRVELSIVNRSDPETGEEAVYARSNTLLSDLRHRKGVVTTRIVRANIPVGNGVVHIIEDPLMIIDITIWDFLQKESNVYSDFFQLVSYSPEFRVSLENMQEKTLFVPTNAAIRKLSHDKFTQLRNNVTTITTLLKLHMVMKSVSSEDVYAGTVTESLSADNRRMLYFKVHGDENSRVLTVDGGGVNATVIEPDIGALDGLIHVIDRLLGMPYQTVLRKLETDPDLTITARLAKESGWGHQLADLSQRYTFFVPNDEAWATLLREQPSSYKRLNMVSLYEQILKKILDRHLTKKAELSLQDLEKLDYVDMVGATFKIVPGYNFGEMVVEWEGLRATIVRSDVHATNGVLHIVNRVLMKPRDMQVSAAATPRWTLAAYSIFVLASSILLEAILM